VRPCLISRLVGPVAQLVEQLTFNQRVTGSNPVRLTTFSLIDRLVGTLGARA
jgi:hypothetical protein